MTLDAGHDLGTVLTTEWLAHVLQALATTAPPVLSKAARKALFSFRSAGKG